MEKSNDIFIFASLHGRNFGVEIGIGSRMRTKMLNFAKIVDDWEALPPLRFSSLLDRLETVAALNKALGALEKDGMALYLTTSTKYVKVPYRVDEGFMATHDSQEPEYIQAVRFHIAEYIGERLRLPDNVSWILPDEDDDFPF